MTYRVRRPRAPLTPGAQRERERAILEALTPEQRGAHAVLLGALGLPADASWLHWPILARLFELLAWLNLTARAEARGLTRGAAESAAAAALHCDRRTLQSRQRDYYRGNSPALAFARDLNPE